MSHIRTVIICQIGVMCLLLIVVQELWNVENGMKSLMNIVQQSDLKSEADRTKMMREIERKFEVMKKKNELVEAALNQIEVRKIEKENPVVLPESIESYYAKAEYPPLSNGTLSYLPTLDGENVVSMSLWGADPKYTLGAIRNAELIKLYFPGWKLRIYCEDPGTEKPRVGPIPDDIVEKLRSLGAELHFMDPSETAVPPMMWRFLIADDMSVDRFIIRDTDSRLSSRDSAAVYQWVQSGKAFHCIRDHPSHAGASVSGGLWGGLPSMLREILRRPWKEIMYGYKSDYSQDMLFLEQVIWRRVKERAMCSDSISCDKWPSSKPFPVPRHSFEHVGQVFDQHDLSRPIDVQILKEHVVNKACSPMK